MSAATSAARNLDLSVVIVSADDAHWLEPCLTSVQAHAGACSLDLVVVDNACTDGTADLVRTRFPGARVVASPNRGFAHGNNRALMSGVGRHVLFLNPDTEILAGELAALVARMDADPGLGVLGVRQMTADGELYPTIRRFPNAARALGEAVASERWPLRPGWAGERVLDPAAYERITACDWMTGAFLLVRHEALLSAGFMDERLFLYADEPDLCLRIRRAGWRIEHDPAMTIVHHAGKAGLRPRLAAQDAFARRIYAEKHFAGPHRAAYLAALGARYAVRAAAPGGGGAGRERRTAARAALRTLARGGPAPFVEPPPAAIDLTTLEAESR